MAIKAYIIIKFSPYVSLVYVIILNFKSSVKLICGDKSADCKKLFAVMGLGVKCGSEIKITADGEDEESAVSELKKFLEENL